MNARAETRIEASTNLTLLKSAFGEKRLLQKFKIKLETNTRTSDAEYTLDELEEALTTLSLEDAQNLFRSISEHGNIRNLAATPQNKVDSYFYDFVEAAHKIIEEINNCGATTLEELMSALFPTVEKPPSTEVTVSAVEVVTQKIENCIQGATIDLGAAREAVHGLAGIDNFPGKSMLEIVQEIVGPDIEIIIDNHTLALNATRVFAKNGTKISDDLLAYMLGKVPGGDQTNNYDHNLIAELYITNNANTPANAGLLKTLRRINDKNNSTESRVGHTSAEHLGGATTALAAKRVSGNLVLAPSDFQPSFTAHLNKTFYHLEGFEKRIRAFFNRQGNDQALEGFTFESNNGLEKLTPDEINNGLAALKVVLEDLASQGKTILGPAIFRETPALQFLVKKSNQVKGTNLSARVRTLATACGEDTILVGITIISDSEEKRLEVVKKHIQEVETLLKDRTAPFNKSDVSNALKDYVSSNYQKIGGGWKQRLPHFLRNNGRSDLAQKFEKLVN